MSVPKKASKTKKAVAVAMVCGGVVAAMPRTAAAETSRAPDISHRVPGSFTGGIKAGDTTRKAVKKWSDIVLKRAADTREKHSNIVLKRGADTSRQ